MSEKIVVCLEKGGARDMAEAFSRRTNTPIAEKPGEHLTVLFNSKGVSLTGYGLTYQGDFENMLHRVTHGRLQHEMLVRASKSEKPGRKAIDATAGMGEDGFLLAAQGYEVTLYEQNPVIAVLLKDALRRAKKHPVLKEIAARMKLAELQLIQKLEPPCSQETDLFDAAISADPDKIIVKRPLKSEFLAGRKPSYTLSGKAIRYDCYTL